MNSTDEVASGWRNLTAVTEVIVSNYTFPYLFVATWLVMKFGKQLQAQQIPTWTAYYLDYKGLKKIINSLAKGRPADAALLAAGISPAIVTSTATNSHQQLAADQQLQLLPESYNDPRASPENNLKLHKAAFFFKLERELEKINEFYLQKESDLKVRLRTLIDKRKVVQCSRTRRLTKDNSSFATLYEGFRHFEEHLRKLQAFVDINQTGFRKILKKWDKRSKSSTKELYLSRQVEVQPVFNRECIAELNDAVAANILELEELLVDSEDRQPRSHASDPSADQISTDWKQVLDHPGSQRTAPQTAVEIDIIEFEELETNLIQAVKADNREQVAELLHLLPLPSSPLEQTTSVRSRLGRILWKAALSVEEPQAQVVSKSHSAQGSSNRITILTPSTAMVENDLIPSSRLDFSFVDDISGRSCLHEAASAGRTRLIRQAIEHKVSVSAPDVYGRQPLHYAAMNGFAQACQLLLTYNADPYCLDHDGYTPLIYSVTKGRVDCVRILLDSGISLEPVRHAGLLPLSLACQHGHGDIALLMLKRGSQVLANQEGMWPQHLAAREGHAALLRLLADAGANMDERDTFSQWTPLFHAASEGHAECVEALIASDCDCQVLDESRKCPIHYAAWQGHIGCVNLLLAKQRSTRLTGMVKQDSEMTAGPSTGTQRAPSAPNGALPSEGIKSGSLMTGSSTGIEPADADVDLIPDLSLPPPIIPFRIYGHNYLDKKALVQLYLGHPNTARSTRKAIQLYGQPELTSLKLVISNRSDVSSVVHSTILPLDYERESFSFHTDSVDHFALEFELFPTFGTKIMGKAVGLPSNFEGPCNQKPCVLPLLDKYLKVIGEVAFELNVIRPFRDVQLSFGGRVETYWKAMTNFSASTIQGDSPMGSPFGTPSINLASNAFVTASSLSGKYVQVAVQVTRDGVPVVYSGTTLNVHGFEIPMYNVTIAQFMKLANDLSRTFDSCSLPSDDESPHHWHEFLKNSMVTLESVLERLPISLGLDLEIGDPGISQHGSLDLNTFVDAILKTIYDSTAKTTPQNQSHRRRRRRLVLSSFEPLVCTALNWKQPNYAVFFASDCGVSGWNESTGQLLTPSGSAIETSTCHGNYELDRRRRSILEAAKVAKANNLLGVRLNATLLLRVPSLIQSTKEMGLLLTSFGPESKESIGLGVDGYMSSSGVFEYASHVEPDLIES
ncbi:uncharacterized protein PGTG_08685 [Puccinia graminis f. sp. tritici CRL 75-36-700-3]|uniref:Phosphate system positive regulatory protein pho81 n=2 Tax=Puccinia graminis f. sp. tritici TaxID=56615 RepID=E3KGS4_PUCGT|nr:uncharacterized protein PGTG_08685 [Puccinia graminis f. sp. tritici CRL 75-36-700-3]EFP83499.2 hypothetical protein PGTG_08685 [Puccinia graminis f. sp. tritici CRL 75-36-700-3]